MLFETWYTVCGCFYETLDVLDSILLCTDYRGCLNLDALNKKLRVKKYLWFQVPEIVDLREKMQ